MPFFLAKDTDRPTGRFPHHSTLDLHRSILGTGRRCGGNVCVMQNEQVLLLLLIPPMSYFTRTSALGLNATSQFLQQSAKPQQYHA